MKPLHCGNSPFQTSGRTRASLIAFCAALCALAAPSARAAAARVPLPGPSIPAEIAAARPLGRVPATQTLRLTFVLPLRNQAELDDLQHRLYDKTDPLYGRYLTSAEFTARFGPSRAEVSLVSRYAAAHGLTLQDVTPNHTLVHVMGPVSAIENTFGIHLNNYVAEDGHDFYAPDAAPTLTSDIAGHVLGVLGLDTAQVPRHPTLRITTPDDTRATQLSEIPGVFSSSGAGLTPNDIHSAYNIPTGAGYDGSGQVLALYEPSTYTQSDIPNFQNTFHLPFTPVTPVSVDGFDTSAPTTYLDGSAEATLDIDMMLDLAPNAAQILVYEGSDSASIYSKIASDNLASVVSTSWSDLVDDSQLPNSSTLEASLHQSFIQMSMQGQSMFADTFDGGAYPNQLTLGPNATLSVAYPSSDPNLTAVGGGSFTDNSTEQYVSESSWADPTDKHYHVNSQNIPDGVGTGGGGGVSQYFSLPDYQVGAFTGSSNPQGSSTMRNVPDVSLYGNYNEGEYAVYFTNRDINNNPLPGLTGLSGTSAATPLWAAFTALIDQQRALNGKSRIGFLNPSLYAILADSTAYAADFHDINDGSNNLFYNAVAGYDNATGIGSFIGVNLIGDLSGTFVALARNDNFANALPITADPANPGTVTGSNLGATSEPGEPLDVANSGGHSIWWVWTPAVSGTAYFNTTGTFAVTRGVYTGTAVDALTPVTLTASGGGDALSTVAGTKYYFSIDGYGTAEGTVTLTLSETTPPPGNDNFTNRYPIAADPANPAAVSGTNYGATSEPSEPANVPGSGGHSVWWKWTAPASGTVTIDTYGSTFDTTLGVYIGSAVNALGPIASNDDAGGTVQSSVTFSVTAGVTFEISVDGFASHEGNISLHLSESVPAPGNDNFANRATITAAPGNLGTATGTNYGATTEPGEPLNTQGSGGNSVWWTWTASVSSSVTIDTYGSSFDTTLGIYTGSALNTLSLIASNDDAGGTRQSSVTFNAVAGVTYAILVDGYATAEGNVTLHVTQAYPVPAITSFTPTSGPANTLVSIRGTAFTGATSVKFNGTAAAFVTVNSDTQVSCYVTSGATTGPIAVTAPGGTATSAANFTVILPPTITSFTPSSGPVGTSVVVTGTHFTGATTVDFSGAPSPKSATFTVNSDTKITVIVPAGAITGRITVYAPGGSAGSTASFTVIPPPTITSFTPISGTAFTDVTITGTHFTNAVSVTFHGSAATGFTVNSDTQITVSVPSGATSGQITVTTPGGTATSAGSFTVFLPPTITSFTPTSGSVGTVVTITGTRLAGTTGVQFNSFTASYTVNSDTQITAIVPAHAMTGLIGIDTNGGSALSSASFTVTAPPPTITSFTPTSGPAGTVVVITGTGFTGATYVEFDGTNASYTVNSDTQITATVPSGAMTGPLSVTTPAGTTARTNTFTVTASVQKPTITGFTPTSGPVGTAVTITGTNLTGATVVGFQGQHATSFTVNGAGTQITTTVPAGAVTGPIAVATPGGTAKSGTAFTVTTASGPTIASFSPTSGPVGTSVTITGTSFTGATSVKFHGTAATYTVHSATQITAAVPGGATTGTLTVTTAGGTAMSSASFTVTIAAPTITSFAPASGPVGATVVIMGTNLTGTTVVGFTGRHATSFTVNGTGTQITAIVPAGAVMGPIAVATPGGTAKSSTAFTVN